MRADAKQCSGAEVDVSSLVDTWVNAKPGTDHIVKIVVTEQEGALLIRPFGAPAANLVDWGETRATPYAVSGTTEAAGFHARYQLGPVVTELAANEKLGILVIQSYTSFQDGSGRLSHYSREFFHRSPSALVTGNGAVDIGSLAGDWVNTNPTTRWITGFTLAGSTGLLTLHAYGARGVTDWGKVEAIPYQDDLGEPAFHASYDLGPIEALLAANAPKGLIVIAAFIRFKDSAAINSQCREFFVRKP